LAQNKEPFCKEFNKCCVLEKKTSSSPPSTWIQKRNPPLPQ
jgi:hypothetical protein